jgi:hypothetical protein
MFEVGDKVVYMGPIERIYGKVGEVVEVDEYFLQKDDYKVEFVNAEPDFKGSYYEEFTLNIEEIKKYEENNTDMVVSANFATHALKDRLLNGHWDIPISQMVPDGMLVASTHLVSPSSHEDINCRCDLSYNKEILGKPLSDNHITFLKDENERLNTDNSNLIHENNELKEKVKQLEKQVKGFSKENNWENRWKNIMKNKEC